MTENERTHHALAKRQKYVQIKHPPASLLNIQGYKGKYAHNNEQQNK